MRIASLSRIDRTLHPDPTVVGRFFAQKPLAPEELATIRSRAATIADDLLERAEREARAGAQIVFFIVLDPSNDWKAIDPWHTRMASFRAIEQGFNLVRHTSLGLSGAFDYQGHPLATMDHYLATERTLVSQVPTRGVRTPYARFGDWFAWASLAGLVVLVAGGRFHRRHPEASMAT